ncbi:MAG: hypothetical protein WC254_00285 [Candidatus Woesearchaeota archaeon]|jgi:hypothetical protein
MNSEETLVALKTRHLWIPISNTHVSSFPNQHALAEIIADEFPELHILTEDPPRAVLDYILSLEKVPIAGGKISTGPQGKLVAGFVDRPLTAELRQQADSITELVSLECLDVFQRDVPGWYQAIETYLGNEALGSRSELFSGETALRMYSNLFGRRIIISFQTKSQVDDYLAKVNSLESFAQYLRLLTVRAKPNIPEPTILIEEQPQNHPGALTIRYIPYDVSRTEIEFLQPLITPYVVATFDTRPDGDKLLEEQCPAVLGKDTLPVRMGYLRNTIIYEAIQTYIPEEK